MIEREINKSALMDVIEYELNWREQATKQKSKKKTKKSLQKKKNSTQKKKKMPN